MLYYLIIMCRIKGRISFFLFLVFLFSNTLCFSQSVNFYINKITENSEKYKMYQKNFNIYKYDPAVVKKCFAEMVNDLRQQLYGVSPMVNIPMLDSVAWMQAEYQALYDKISVKNEAPFQNSSQRLKKFGFTVQGQEFVSKAKAHLGDKEYSYYDLCIELLKPLLKTSSGHPSVLSPQYTIFGFACDLDKYRRSMYISFVLGNDLSNQVFNSVGSKQKNLPISKGMAGLKFYEEDICKKCEADPALELIHDMLYWNEDGEVFLEHHDAKWVKRIFKRAGNAIVLDFIQKEQYNSRVPQVDNNKPFRGIVSKPKSIDKIIALNDSTPKSNYFHAKIGAIPPPIELNNAIDINILLLNGKKVVCRTLIKKNVRDIKSSDLVADSLIREYNFEEALYRLSPSLSDSTISETQLFSIIQLAAHKPKTYLSSLFTKSVQIAMQRNPQRLCKLLDEFSVSIFDNAEVRKIFCEKCR